MTCNTIQYYIKDLYELYLLYLHFVNDLWPPVDSRVHEVRRVESDGEQTVHVLFVRHHVEHLRLERTVVKKPGVNPDRLLLVVCKV